MTVDHERSEKSAIGSSSSQIFSFRLDPAARIRNVDFIAILVAVLLPWSTSGVGIGMVLWLAAMATTLDLVIGERTEGPILRRHDGARLDPRTANRWVRTIGKRAGLDHVHPHMLRAAFIIAALDAGVPLRDVQIAARHADPRTTTVYDRRRQNYDRHAAYAVVAFVTSG